MGPDALLSDSRLRFGGITYELHERLGNGRFATVYAMRAPMAAAGIRSADPPLAAKVSLLPGMSAWRARAARRGGVDLVGGLLGHGLHPNIVRFVGSISSADRHVAILERAVGGELFDRIIKLSHFDEATAARQVGQVLSAVDHLHLHGDRPSRPQAREPAPRHRRRRRRGEGRRLWGGEAAARPDGRRRGRRGSLGYAAPDGTRAGGLRAGAYPGGAP